MGTGAAVDLADIVILGNYNGNGWSETIPFATGTTLGAGEVFVVANSSSDDVIPAEADVSYACTDHMIQMLELPTLHLLMVMMCEL